MYIQSQRHNYGEKTLREANHSNLGDECLGRRVLIYKMGHTSSKALLESFKGVFAGRGDFVSQGLS